MCKIYNVLYNLDLCIKWSFYFSNETVEAQISFRRFLCLMTCDVTCDVWRVCSNFVWLLVLVLVLNDKCSSVADAYSSSGITAMCILRTSSKTGGSKGRRQQLWTTKGRFHSSKTNTIGSNKRWVTDICHSFTVLGTEAQRHVVVKSSLVVLVECFMWRKLQWPKD